MIRQGEMENSSGDDVDTMVEDQPIVPPEQDQEMRQNTPRLQSTATDSQPHTLGSHPRSRTPETHPLGGLHFLGFVMPQKPDPAVPTLVEAGTCRKTSDMNVDHQQLGELVGGDSLPDLPLSNIPLPVLHLEGSVGEKRTSIHLAEEVKVVKFGVGLGSCLVRVLGSNLFISGIDYYTCCEVFGSLRVTLICGFCIGFNLFIVLWDIAHAAFLQLLACKEPPCHGVKDQQISPVSWLYRELTHQSAQTQHQLLSPSTVYTPLFAICRQCKRRLLSVAPNFYGERSSPQTAGDLIISNYTILNTFKLHTSRVWLFAVHPNSLNTLSTVNSRVS